ncbi:MAG: hypothetical protein FD153_1366, partial [Rhodospirillaceae bacterium]
AAGSEAAVEGGLSSGLWISIITNLVASTAVSVLCHRIIILGEWPAGLRSVHFGRREIYYLLALLGFSFIVVLMMSLFAGLIRVAGLESGGFGASVVVIAALALYARVSLAFPDLAVTEGRVPWHVWHASHGQTIRIIMGVALAGLPPALVVQQLVVGAAILHGQGMVEIAAAIDFLGLFVTFLAMMSSAAFLSFVYKLLILGGPLPVVPSPEGEDG